MRFRFLAVLAAALASAGTATAAVALLPVDPWPVNFGVNINNFTPQSVNWAAIAKVAHWVRAGDSWYSVEKVRGKYDWKRSDGYVLGARAHGLNCIVAFCYGNKLYGSPNILSPPTTTAQSAQLAAFVRFAVAMVDRYGTKGMAYEIWNEPDAPIFWNRHDGKTGAAQPVDYGQMDVAVYNAVKAKHPDAVVVGGGGSGGSIDMQFSRSVADLGLAKGDLWSTHGYRRDRPESVRTLEVPSLKGYPGLPPLCQTEWGWSPQWTFNGAPIAGDEHKTAAIAVRIAMQGMEQRWPINIYFNWQDGFLHADMTQWGLLRRNGQPKPSYVALTTLKKVIGGYSYASKGQAPANCTALLFQKGRWRVVIAWNDTTNAATGASVMPIPPGAKVTGIDGARIAVKGTTVLLGYSPVMIAYKA